MIPKRQVEVFSGESIRDSNTPSVFLLGTSTGVGLGVWTLYKGLYRFL